MARNASARAPSGARAASARSRACSAWRARAGHPEHRRIGGLAERGVGAPVPGLHRVHDVVDDLEGQAELLAVRREAAHQRRASAAHQRAHPCRGREQRARLATMDGTDARQRRGMSRRGEIEGLAAHHAGLARGAGQLADGGERAPRRHGGRGGHEAEGLGEERVAHQDRDALAEDAMAGGAPAAQVVVVHGGEIVVHQRVGVDQLEGAGEGHDGAHRRARHLSRGECEDRA